MSLRDITLLLFIVVTGGAAGYAQGLTSKDIVGKWVSSETSRGEITDPGKGRAVRYEFRSNGTYVVVGVRNTTTYGCATTLFTDMWGNYELEGDKLVLTPMRNFWRRNHACAPGGEIDVAYSLVAETFDVSVKLDEKGSGYLCLASASGEDCFRQIATRVKQ